MGASVISGIGGTIGVSKCDSKMASFTEKNINRILNSELRNTINTDQLNKKAEKALKSIKNLENCRRELSTKLGHESRDAPAVPIVMAGVGAFSAAIRAVLGAPGLASALSRFTLVTAKVTRVAVKVAANIAIVLNLLVGAYDIVTFSDCEESKKIDKTQFSIDELIKDYDDNILKHSEIVGGMYVELINKLFTFPD